MEYELENQGIVNGEEASASDYLLGTSNALKLEENTNTNNYYYNQAAQPRTYNACVLYGNAAALGYTMDYEFSTEELLEIVDSAEKDYFRKQDGGMTLSRGTDCVRRYWNNKFPDRKVKSFRMVIGDEDFLEALNNNYRVVVGYRTSRKYYEDSQDDGIVDGEKFTDHIGGHCVSSIRGVAEIIRSDQGIIIEDNYTGRKKYNRYYNNNLFFLKESGTFFPHAYVFVKDKTLEETIRDNIDLEGAKKAFDLGLWNGMNPREPMSRQEVMTVLMRGMEK